MAGHDTDKPDRVPADGTRMTARKPPKLTPKQERQEHVWRRNAMIQARSPEEAEALIQSWREQRERAREFGDQEARKT